MSKDKYKIILSGGGTGGHIYPAVAVAEALRRELGDRVELLFVGAQGKMEMEKVPALGYKIVGLPVAGLQRRLDVRNFALPFKVAESIRRAKQIVKEFDADAVAGFGGYASAPILWAAQRLGIPTLIQEQNSYAGVTNKILSRRARRICVAYDGMERFFPAERIIYTGNPLRGDFGKSAPRDDAYRYFGLNAAKPTLLIVGGSLGTRTLNEAMKLHADRIGNNNEFQVIWQTGKYYEREMNTFMESRPYANIWHGAFIERMDYAYTIADVVISRSGACSVSELELAGKSVIFVPSPNVAEDHQTKNARALSDKNAAMLIPDSEAVERAIPAAEELLRDEQLRRTLENNIRQLATPEAARDVAQEIIKLIEQQ